MKKSGFLFRSAWPTIIRRFSHRFGAASYSVFPHRGKKQRKKVLFSWKSRFTDCPWKIAPASAHRESRKSRLRDIQSQRVYIYIYLYIKRSFTGKELRIHVRTVRSRPCAWIHVSGDFYSRGVCPSSCLVPCSCRHLLRMTGSGWASVLNTQSSSGSRSSSENSRYRYLWWNMDRVNKTHLDIFTVHKNTVCHSLKCPYYAFTDFDFHVVCYIAVCL